MMPVIPEDFELMCPRPDCMRASAVFQATRRSLDSSSGRMQQMRVDAMALTAVSLDAGATARTTTASDTLSTQALPGCSTCLPLLAPPHLDMSPVRWPQKEESQDGGLFRL